jgi:hypothetical protein
MMGITSVHSSCESEGEVEKGDPVAQVTFPCTYLLGRCLTGTRPTLEIYTFLTSLLQPRTGTIHAESRAVSFKRVSNMGCGTRSQRIFSKTEPS